MNKRGTVATNLWKTVLQVKKQIRGRLQPTPKEGNLIDTITLGIPLTEKQFTKLDRLIVASCDFVPAKISPLILRNSEDPREAIFLKYIRTSQIITRGSWEKEILVTFPSRFEPGNTLVKIEVSLPKLVHKGDNIRLLYDIESGLQLLKRIFEREWKLTLPPIENWQISRLDVCYAWKVPSQDLAQQLLDSCKQLNFPWKKPTIYSTAIQFPGKTYTVKLYLKLPEFRRHDKKALLKLANNLEDENDFNQLKNHIEYLENIAEGVIRFEVGLKQIWLKRNRLTTVRKLLAKECKIEMDESLDLGFDDPISYQLPLAACATYNLFVNQSNMTISQLIDSADNGQRFEAPPYQDWPIELKKELEDGFRDFIHRYYQEIPGLENLWSPLELEETAYRYPGGGLTVIKQSRVEVILQDMWKKFIGSADTMDDKERVLAILTEAKEPRTAQRLFGFWSFVRDFGKERAKQYYGRDSYYRALRDLKKAGISIAATKVFTVDQDFLDKFRFSIPSPWAVNQTDTVLHSGDRMLNQPIIPNLNI